MKVIDFILKRFPTNSKWMDGNCYYFSVILKARFPELQIVYCPIPGHFMARDTIENKFYDWSGIYNEDEIIPFYVWDSLQEEEPALYKRILEDCVK